jgi:hypothetical protein
MRPIATSITPIITPLLISTETAGCFAGSQERAEHAGHPTRGVDTMRLAREGCQGAVSSACAVRADSPGRTAFVLSHETVVLDRASAFPTEMESLEEAWCRSRRGASSTSLATEGEAVLRRRIDA